MKTFDQRVFIAAILCGAGAGLVLTPQALNPMPIDVRVANGLDDFVEKGAIRRRASRPAAPASLGLLVA